MRRFPRLAALLSLLLLLLTTGGMLAQAADVRCALRDHCCCDEPGPVHGDCCQVATITPPLVASAPPPPVQWVRQRVTIVVEELDWLAQARTPVPERVVRPPCGLRAPPPSLDA